ncbi:hypothetical protein U3A58_08630 [Algoriphagus sp. C2-6-M1]|nr:hypothetical protein [Algoriphagus sp. C2-6-M1]MEB2780456.1 hypothetical protein [Algoriphagus sp. C2-6-M1]
MGCSDGYSTSSRIFQDVVTQVDTTHRELGIPLREKEPSVLEINNPR